MAFDEEYANKEDDLVLWLPIFSLGGIILRFYTKTNLIFLLFSFILSCLVSRKHKILKCLALCFGFFIFGYCRTEIFLLKPKTHIIDEYVGDIEIYGKIEKEIISIMDGGGYKKEILIKPTKIIALKNMSVFKKLPKKILVRLKNFNTKLYLSDVIARGYMLPPMSKKFLSDFDYKKYLYYKGIGGIVYSGEIIENDTNQKLSLIQKINIFRHKLAQDIIGIRKSRSGTVIAALITGQKNLVDRDVKHSMNYSGLSHLLSISGIHMMGLLTSVFFVVKWILASFETIALKYNVTVIAIVTSMSFNFIYLVLSGVSISALRAYLMCLFLLVSMLIGRYNDAKRIAFFVLFLLTTINPAIVFDIGFQLSFLSVISIISMIKYHNSYTKVFIRNLFRNKNTAKIVNYILLNFSISLVAEIANTPVTIYNFNNYTFYNVITNTIAGPLVSLIILPFSTISAILYFINLEKPLIILASYAMDLVLFISDYTLSIKNSIIFLPSPNNLAMFLMIFSVIFFSIFKTNIKYYGLLFYFFGVLTFLFQREPDVFIDTIGKSAYFINKDKELFIYNPNIYDINNTFKKTGANRYVDITDSYKKEKYLIFYKGKNYLILDLKKFEIYNVENLDKIKDTNGFLSVFL
ncbi:MAG: ComEC family competence protein [Rickettsiales bacterium]|jgi:ComEC/Rec2-related protein|nr:ComEC family competence protein [Rickettsiales bacterium]